jgi:hypothetical protein
MTKYTIFWDSGQPGANGKSTSWPCGWCWIATDENGETLGSGTLGASGRPKLADIRSLRSLVQELRAQVKGTRLPLPPTYWSRLGYTGPGAWDGTSCVIQ